ncbi:MAG: hypothetical protein WBM02_12485 [bacterium]
MTWDVLDHAKFTGPAFPSPYVRVDLEQELIKKKLLPKTTGSEGKKLQDSWDAYRRKLRNLVSQGGSVRVCNHVFEPLVERLSFKSIAKADDVGTREGLESGGYLLTSQDGGPGLRVWATDMNDDLDAPARRGRAYRFSPVRIAQRVLPATGERLGLISNGSELRILICDPARPDSQIEIPIDPYWKKSRKVPDTYRLLLALACPAGIGAVPELVEKARLQQSAVTKELRVQARQAIVRFVQSVLDHPANQDKIQEFEDKQKLSVELWREGLIIIYRILFILKLEAGSDPARAFSFASTSLWRNTFSPSVALAPYARKVLDKGEETRNLLEDGLRNMFRMFSEGLECTELNVKPLGGALFGDASTPILSNLHWGEHAVAHLLDRLLWTPKKRGSEARERVHYGPLDVEDLGRVYEALLELEPGYSTETMCRLRRQKLEVVVPAAQGETYRPVEVRTGEDPEFESTDAEEDEDEPVTGKKTKVEWVEEIPAGRFYLRVGLGRKASGSYYTPHSFVRFLVQETLGPQVEERSPKDDPNPNEILKLKTLDPAMGSGHFLVEACRFLGDKLYEACRLCDEIATETEKKIEDAGTKDSKAELKRRLETYRQRILDLPDPEDEIIQYLPSRAPEGEESGLSQKKAEALCRRLVAVHCLYGVDKNPLAVELAKLTLWIETHAEGMPLTFMDHRLVVGDSLTGAFWDRLIFRPGKPDEPIRNLFHEDLDIKFSRALGEALKYARDLEASVGVSVSEINHKQKTKEELDMKMLPFRIAAAAWSGGVMLGPDKCDDEAYSRMMQHIADNGQLPNTFDSAMLRGMIARGLGADTIPSDRESLYEFVKSGGCVPALPYDLTFPEVFYPTGVPHGKRGFNAILGNPPWDTVRKNDDQFFGAFDFSFLNPPAKPEKSSIKKRLLQEPKIASVYEEYVETLKARGRINDLIYFTHKVKVKDQLAGRGTYDDYMLFAERGSQIVRNSGLIGFVLPSAFHANEGATGVRQLYLEKMKLTHCYSFENRRKLFEIDSRIKFALVVVKSGEVSDEFSCAFYLHDDEWLFGERKEPEPLKYKIDFIRKTGGDYLSLLELRSETDLKVAEKCIEKGEPFGDVCDRLGIKLSQELNMTYDSWRFTPTTEVLPGGEDPRDPDITKQLIDNGHFILHEGKTFWHYDDHWENRPVYCVPIFQIKDKPDWIEAGRYFRIAYRAVASATNERTVIFSLIPPGAVFGNSAPVEREPSASARFKSVMLMAAVNTFTFDWTARVRTGSNMNKFILFSCPLPPLQNIKTFLVHSAVRLSCNHKGYLPLWIEQLKDAWREAKPRFSWPVLESDDERWEIRAAIDSVVADAYGLNRDQYQHILSSFSHAGYDKAPELCLTRFDELKQIGLEAFTKKYDPYWDIPLNENLPQPDPAVSAAIEKYLGEAGKAKGGKRNIGEGQKELFEKPLEPKEKEE